jgi:hypothetical protein
MSLTDPGAVELTFSTCPLASSDRDFLELHAFLLKDG